MKTCGTSQRRGACPSAAPNVIVKPRAGTAGPRRSIVNKHRRRHAKRRREIQRLLRIARPRGKRHFTEPSPCLRNSPGELLAAWRAMERLDALGVTAVFVFVLLLFTAPAAAQGRPDPAAAAAVLQRCECTSRWVPPPPPADVPSVVIESKPSEGPYGKFRETLPFVYRYGFTPGLVTAWPPYRHAEVVRLQVPRRHR